MVGSVRLRFGTDWLGIHTFEGTASPSGSDERERDIPFGIPCPGDGRLFSLGKESIKEAIMAQTKASPSRRRASSRTRSSKASQSRSNASRTRSASPARSSSNGRSAAHSVKETVTSGTENAAHGVAAFAKKAKTPLLAGGAALAGVAGTALVTARSRRRRKVLGVSLPKSSGLTVDAKKITQAIADSAKRADHFGQRMSRVANGVQDVAETANATAKKS
jgi:hypothetical protein